MSERESYIGKRVLRVEDDRLLRGRGRYLDDLPEPRGTLHVGLLRSPHAHARIRGVDTSAARALPGVFDVLTGGDVAPIAPPFQVDQDLPGFKVTRRPVVAIDRVRFVGEIVAVVLADNAYVAEDALALVTVDYDSLPAVAAIEDGSAPGAPRVHEEAADNVLFAAEVKTPGFDAAFAAAAHVVGETFYFNRVAGVSLEARGCLAVFDEGEESLTLWSSTQTPHLIRNAIADYLGWGDTKVRVIAPDVGGGFGPKLALYPEELLTAALARRTGRPIKWVQDRLDDFLSTIQSRDQRFDMAMALGADGRILAVRADIAVNMGAYSSFPFDAGIESNGAVMNLPGPYTCSDFWIKTRSVATHTVPTGAYRGVSAPTATLAIEGLLDRAARLLRIDPAEIRLRNLVQPDQFPYRNALGLNHDCGSYVESLRLALDRAGYDDYRREQTADRLRDGKYRGIGIATVVELTGQGASRYRSRKLFNVPGYDSALVKVEPSGRVLAYVSQATQGQGHLTVFAQLVAEGLGISIDRVKVVQGDTQTVPFGTGTFASRGVVVAGGAVMKAVEVIRDKAKRIAAHLLEASPLDIRLADDHAHVAGVPAMRVDFADIAAAAHALRGKTLPAGEDFGLESIGHYSPDNVPLANAAHIAWVAVDPRTGLVDVERYLVVHDCGRLLNPLLVEGQIQGGVVQGLGQVFTEHVRHDEQGQLLTATLLDYMLPTAPDVPDLEIEHIETVSQETLGGFKGMGESGVIGALPALANAVADALSGLGVTVNRLPLRPDRVRALIDTARASET